MANTYRVNWNLDNWKGEVKAANDTITAEPEDVEFFLASGVLSIVEASNLALEDMDQPELLAFAKSLGLKPDPKTGKKKLLEAIKGEQDRLLAEQKSARIAELEALGDNRSADETAELDELKG